MNPSVLASFLFASFLLSSMPAAANQRRLSYTYESLTLTAGETELELWVSPRIGREDNYVRFDNRVEFEYGVTDRLVTSAYVNVTSIHKHSPKIEGSLSNEWKYKLLDPVADPIGFAVYGEWTYSPVEFELEAKLIVDKHVGNLLLAANFSAEHAWETSDGKLEREVKLAPSLGLSYLVTPHLGLGIEGRARMVFTDEGLRTGIYVGPGISYSRDGGWFSLTFAPQVAAIKPGGATDVASKLDLLENERYAARLLVGFHI